MLKHRTVLKWLHWVSFGLILYFFFVEPEDVQRLGAVALATHAGMGAILGLLVTIWFVLYLRKGLASRPGPKLPGWAKPLHPLSHRFLTWGMPMMVFTGALAGFAAPYAIRLFGVIPFFPGIGAQALHQQMQNIHEVAFNVILAVIVSHALFHLWRHFGLKDNALRIMLPRVLHKYL